MLPSQPKSNFAAKNRNPHSEKKLPFQQISGGLQSKPDMTAPTADIGSARLTQLAERLDAQEGYAEVVAALQAGHGGALGGVWGSSCALVAANLMQHAPAALVVVCPRAGDVDDFCDELAVFSPTNPAERAAGLNAEARGDTTQASQAFDRFPAWETAPGEHGMQDEAYGDRLRVLKLLSAQHSTEPASPRLRRGAEVPVDRRSQRDPPAEPGASGPNKQSRGQNHATPKLIVTSIQALLQPVPSRELLEQHTVRLRVGEEIDPATLLRRLAEGGFHNTSAVELPGEFSPRGGIVDVFAQDWFHPVRIEFFGDTIESIRQFEVSTQRSLETLEAIEITMLPVAPDGAPRGVGTAAKQDVDASDSVPHALFFLLRRPGSWFLIVEPHEMQEEARHYRQRLDNPQSVHDLDDVLAAIYRFPSVTAAAVASGSMESECQLRIESVERFSGDIAKVRDELDTVGLGYDVFIVCPTEAEVERLREIFGTTKLAANGKLHFPIGRLQSGFRLVSERIVLVSSGELFHRQDLARPTRRRLGRVIDSFLELREGDYVVHLSHGIGRYRGMKLLEKNGAVEEHLEVEFHGGTRIFVPASNIDLVQKYIGGSKRPADVGAHRRANVGAAEGSRPAGRGRSGGRHVASAGDALAAARHRFPPDSEWQREFDAAFPYRETPDQLSAIAAIKHDMRQPRPMDRLLCGDVGYGKTELAIRAAFKAVDAGYQVAVLVPTTILAEQHRRTFTERMAEFPFRIEVLSRFATDRQQRETIAGLIDGSVDIVIGTHRLAQADVNFHNLGLLVIDEEQRFGVEVKERLKALRATVDVLTMTATPIPRTLHMSLLGLRDISNLETPPEDRLAVETRVTRFDEELIRHGIMRELNRNGQVFFVHNRVNDIDLLAVQAAAHRARSPHSHRPRPNAGASTGTSDARFRESQVRHPAGDDDRRKRARYSQRQHHFHRRSRPLRSGRSAPTARPRRPLQASGVLLSAGRSRTSISRPLPPSGCGRSKNSATWGPALPLPCAIWKSAAPETFWARSKAGTSPRSATNCTANCWNRPCAN